MEIEHLARAEERERVEVKLQQAAQSVVEAGIQVERERGERERQREKRDLPSRESKKE